MRLMLRFVVPLVVVLGIIAYAVVPVVDNLMTQWAVRDLDLRAKAIATSVNDSLFMVVTQDHTKTKKKMQNFFNRMMEDQRLYALGFCDTHEALIYETDKFPNVVTCPPSENAGSPTPSEVIGLPQGPVHVMSFPVSGSGMLIGNLVLVHDMSFVQNRSEETRRYIMFFMAGLALLVAVITMAIAELSWRGWVSGLRGLLRGGGLKRVGAVTDTTRELQPVVRELRDLVRDLETDRRLRDDMQTEWSPRTLKELLQKELAGDEVIVVSNREPYIHVREGGGIRVQRPASGLVTALDPIMRACSGTWIAHGGGDADRETVDKDDHVQVPPDHPLYTLRRIWLTREEENGYYFGFANEGLWPLCHIAHVRPVFRTSDWEEYRRVNARFADAVVAEAQTDDPVVLIQDYHFALLPALIRQKLPKASIIAFWHIPWPNPEVFGICPWKKEILEGLLGSSILGFHTRFHCNNFFDTAERYLECKIDREHSNISYGGALTGIQRYPISIEFPDPLLRRAKPVADARAMVREKYHLAEDCVIGIGVDRFDYTKGILEKFSAVERLLEEHPEWIGRFTFIQIVAPTRSKIEEYRKFREETSALSERINRRFGKDGYMPIVLRVEHCDRAEILDYCRAADVCFVASLHDGMNLVAKEFVAARDDERGVLVLSEFTGSSRELPEGLIVNPYDTGRCAEALQAALTMPVSEQRDRLRNMRGFLHDSNVYRWAGRMLLDAARMRLRKRFLQTTDGEYPFSST